MTASPQQKSRAQKAIEFMGQLSTYSPVRNPRTGDIDEVRDLVHGHLITSMHVTYDPTKPPETLDQVQVRWGGAGGESSEHYAEILSIAIVQAARHEVTFGDVDDARARALQLAEHFRSTFGISDFELY
jgi:hypothetical protein